MHPNERLMRQIDEAQTRGDLEAFFDGYTDDVVVHLSGNHSLAGVYKGKDQLRELFAMFMEKTPEFSFENHSYFADDEHGVILQRSHYRRSTEFVDSNDTFVCHFRAGLISEFWITAEDQTAIDRFFG